MRKIAITGAIASGKSTVCRVLKENGAFVVSSDEIAHQLLSLDTPIGQSVIEVLGKNIVQSGEFDRKKIAKIVFHNPEKLKALEKILHPAILQKIQQLYEEKKNKSFSLFVVEMPLLFELHQEEFYDFILCVKADLKTCKNRFLKLGFSEEDFNARMLRQIDPDQKSKKADFTIVNDGLVEDLENKVKQLYPELT